MAKKKGGDMTRSLRVVGCMIVLLFGVTLAEAAWYNKQTMPKRLREEMKTKQEEARARRMLMPEERERREARATRVRNRIRKYIINPIKKLRPRRHPEKFQTETKEEARARRRERINRRFKNLIPQRYPKGYRSDTATGEEPFVNIEPARFSEEEEAVK